MQEKYEIFAKEGLSNLFEGSLNSHSNTKTIEVVGYRLETIKRENVRVIARMPEDKQGVYKATVFFDNHRRKGKRRKSAFFPKTWTKDDVVNAVYEAYQSKIISNEAENEYLGKTSGDMNIILCLNQVNQVIDAVPVQENSSPASHRRSKRNCKICSQPKHYVCPKHYNFKKRGIWKVLGIIKRYSRKFYFYLARKLKLVE